MPDTSAVAVAPRRTDGRGRRRYVPEQPLRADLASVLRRCWRRGPLARPGPPPCRPAAAPAVAEVAFPVFPWGRRAGSPLSQPCPSGDPTGAHPVEPAVARVQLRRREVRRVHPEVADIPAGEVVRLLDHHRVQPEPGAGRVHRKGLSDGKLDGKEGEKGGKGKN